MATPVVAHTESAPQVQTLLAGQDIEVGNVSVWNNETTLYVTYEITESPWIITETHLYAGKNVSPTTAPGQFPYDDGDATSATNTTVTYEIPLDDIDGYSMQLNKKGKPTGKMVADGNPGVEPCNNVSIAAHAVVEKVDTFNECLVSGAGSDDVLYLEEAELTPGYPEGYTADYQTYSGTVTPSVLAWTHNAWAPYGVTGAEWISSSYYTENTDNNTWRLFTRGFDLPTDATNISGTLTMNSDNAEDVYLNGTNIGDGSPAIVYGPSVKDVSPPSGVQHGWNTVEGPWDVSSELIAGTNELWTMTRNYAWSGGPTANPTGLIYKLCYSYDIVTTETAWGNGTDFEQANWAMYFGYHIQLVPCMTPSGNLSITGIGWKSVTAWCPCTYTYNLTAAGEPVALQGWVDLSEAAVANTGDWSKYYAKFSMLDSNDKAVEVVFGNDWLGGWYEMPAQQWDRIRMENNMGLTQPQQHYATVGGVLGYNMTGKWVGAGNGATVYPSDGNYFFQLIADPSAETFTLQVYGMGSSAPANPPNDWPKQNMYDYPTWLEIGTITATDFDFSEVNICAILWASTQAGTEETTTIYWDGMVVDTPVPFGDIPG
jgi:hypothetical protein